MKEVTRMHKKQICNLIQLIPEKRYDFFIRYCADFEQVCGLVVGEDNWVVFKDVDGGEIFPLWPHPDIAEACCFDEHKKMSAKPQNIELKSFLQNCIPDMNSGKVKFGIFYDCNKEGLVVKGDVLQTAIENEVDSVWD